MVVIPLSRRRRLRAEPVHLAHRPAPIHGSFRAPSGGAGKMSGSMRLHRLVLVSGRVRAVGVFTGELFDRDGSRIGVDSRRTIAPADLVRSPAGMSLTIGPLEVALLGLTVDVDAFTVEMGSMRRGDQPVLRVAGGGR